MKTGLDAEEIRALLPHRHPILLVDRVVEMSPDHVVAHKLVSNNEPILQGHFPSRPIFPGVMIVEAIAQAAGVCMLYHSEEQRGLMPALVGIDKARFRRPVLPGDLLELRARLTRARGHTIKFEGEAFVDGERAAATQALAIFLPWEGES